MTGFDPEMTLWYDEPATEWMEALPLGNGRLGAMVFCRPGTDRIQFNEESLWAGGHNNRENHRARENLEAVRELIFNGEVEAAQQLADEKLMGDPSRLRPYLPFGDLTIITDHDEVEDYRRELNLEAGFARATYRIEDTTYTREYFASSPDDVVVVRVEADGPDTLDATVALGREHCATTSAVGDEVILRGQVVDPPSDGQGERGWDRASPYSGEGGWGLRFEGRASVSAENGEVTSFDPEGETPTPPTGQNSPEAAALSVTDADAFTVILTGATSFGGDDPTAVCEGILGTASHRSYEDMRAAHIDDHRDLMERVSLNLGEPVDAPTDERIEAVTKSESDPHLTALYFQFGRYLLVASSRPGTLPANLQGVWNDQYNPPWNSCYTVNINLQMNYWPAEVTNLAECAEPYVDFVDSLHSSGRGTAETHYGCEGFAVHHNTDLWRNTAPVDGARWGMWPTGAAWLACDCWDHYRFTGDRDFLREQIYPTLREASAFLLDFLVEYPEGDWLVTVPSMSPENAYRTADGQKATVTYSPTVDVELIHDLFGSCIDAAEVLGVRDDFHDELAAACERLPPRQIGEHGQLQEWIKDYEEPEPGHRHLSHLYGNHPGAAISRYDDRELTDAVRTSLERRLKHGSFPSGWPPVWVANQFARLGDGERVREYILNSLTESTAPNLFKHQPFQIDANFGVSAGIAESLIQSHNDEVELLPALPDAWDEGSVEGLRARGGYTVDIEWENHELACATVHADDDGPCRVRTQTRIDITRDGSAIETTLNDDDSTDSTAVTEFEAAMDATYRITPHE